MKLVITLLKDGINLNVATAYNEEIEIISIVDLLFNVNTTKNIDKPTTAKKFYQILGDLPISISLNATDVNFFYLFGIKVNKKFLYK